MKHDYQLTYENFRKKKQLMKNVHTDHIMVSSQPQIPRFSVVSTETMSSQQLKMTSHTSTTPTTTTTLPPPADGVWNMPPPYFNPFNLQSWVTFMVLGPVFINFADGCIRRSLFTPQTTTTTTTTSTLSPTPTPSMEDTTGTTMSTSHKQPCLDEEIKNTNCLHGGTCYAVVVNDNRQSFCHCTAEWSGQRCEQVYIDPSILATMEQNMRTANIAAGVSVCILVLFVLLLALYVHLRKKKKEARNARDPAEAESLHRVEPNGRHVIGNPDDHSIHDNNGRPVRDHSPSAQEPTITSV